MRGHAALVAVVAGPVGRRLLHGQVTQPRVLAQVLVRLELVPQQLREVAHVLARSCLQSG